MPPGTHTYNFEVMLPAGLPTSVQNDVGHIGAVIKLSYLNILASILGFEILIAFFFQIAYGVNVVLNIPLWVDKEFKEYFTVIKPINLNVDPSFRVIFFFNFSVKITVALLIV